MISVKNLYHSYNKDGNYQVKDVSFEVEEGEIFGFLGPSGAGKSTVQNILTGLLELQEGSASVAGYELEDISKTMFNKIGMSFEQSNVYSKLTARENLDFYSKLFDVPTVDTQVLLDLVGLGEKGDIRAGEFSKGMKHRLTFARSMINNPELWFLDEPTTGLDPSIAADIKDIIRSKNAQGVTVFLTTHNMFIADELCDRVAFIVDGEIVLIDSPENLKLQYGDKLVEVEYIKDEIVIKETYSLLLKEEKDAVLYTTDTKEIYILNTREDLEYMADKEREIAAVINMDDSYNFTYDYYLQGYESDKYKNLLKILHVERSETIEATMDKQDVRPLSTNYASLSDRENMLPYIAYFMPSWNPSWVRLIPSYHMLEGFKAVLIGNGDLIYLLSISGGFLIMGIVLFGLSNARYKKTLIG